VYAQPAGQGDDALVTLTFEDGSVGSIVYASGGDRAMAKEYLEVFGGGQAVVLDDFRTVRVYRNGAVKSWGGRLARQDKGHSAELSAFLDAVRNGRPSPVDPDEAAHVTRVTFAAVESTRLGQPVQL
jgi:predicted dehydrogenase